MVALAPLPQLQSLPNISVTSLLHSFDPRPSKKYSIIKQKTSCKYYQEINYNKIISGYLLS
jgi:hypothetical protein